MARRMITNVVPQDFSEVRERDRLFRSAKKTLGKASKTVNEDELATLLETLNEIAASLKSRTASDEVEDEDVEEIDNEDDEDEEPRARTPQFDEKEVVKNMRRNSHDNSVQRQLAKDARYTGQHRGRQVENERKSSNPIANAMSEHRGTDAVLRELRKKGR